MLHLQPSVLKADLASASVLQHNDGNFDMPYDRADLKSLDAHSPFTPQISGSHPSLFLNTGHHQRDSLDHLWVRQEQDPSDSPACRLPIQKAQAYMAIQQALPMARVSHQLPKHSVGAHPSTGAPTVVRCRLRAGSMVGEASPGSNCLSSHSPDSTK